MQQDNIKNFAIAAFRFYGHRKQQTSLSENDFTVLFAVSLTLKHLEVDGDQVALAGIRLVYFGLPSGRLKSNVMTNSVRRAAAQMHSSEGTVWNKLRRARILFDKYYKLLLKEKAATE